MHAAGWQLTRRAVSLSGLDRQVFTLFFLWCAAGFTVDKGAQCASASFACPSAQPSKFGHGCA